MKSDSSAVTEQTGHKMASNNPLEQFVQLANGCSGAGCLDLIKQVLEAPGVHVFGEFMQMPQIAEFKEGPHAKYYNTLNLFAYGTFREYIENQDKVLELTPAMQKKLQHLTIVSLAIRSKCIPYSRLLEELHISNVRDLEDIIIEAIYADIIHGKLDQKNKQLEVDNAIGRDIREEDVKDIVDTLQEWCDSCETVLTVIEDQIKAANAEKAKKIKHKEKIEKEITNLKMTVKTQTFDCEEPMDMRDGPAGAGSEMRKKPSKIKASRTPGMMSGPKLQR